MPRAQLSVVFREARSQRHCDKPRVYGKTPNNALVIACQMCDTVVYISGFKTCPCCGKGEEDVGHRTVSVHGQDMMICKNGIQPNPARMIPAFA